MATAINDLGDVVGVATATETGSYAYGFVYMNGQMVNLSSSLNVSGWDINQVNAINDSGEIVGTGEYNGKLYAVLLIPCTEPSPCILLLLSVSILLVWLLARARRGAAAKSHVIVQPG